MRPSSNSTTITGFARLSRLSDAVHMPGPFSEPIRELVAHELGTSSVEAHPDQTASGRDAAAVKAGFNPELIGFPSSAYAAVVFAAGSNLHLPSLPPPQAIESSHPNAVFDPMHGRVLTELEQRLRYTMEKRLSGLVGQNWIRHRVSEEARKRWLKRQKQDRDELAGPSFGTGRERGSTGSRSEQYDVQAISYGLGRISYLLLFSEARPHRTRTGMGQGYVLVSHSGTHLFHRIEATQSKARRQIVSDMTPEEMKKELERLQAENETLKKRSEKELSLKVSQKGGVSVYGLGRFPVTLYKEQWEKLLEMTDDIRAFIQENKAQLKTKDS